MSEPRRDNKTATIATNAAWLAAIPLSLNVLGLFTTGYIARRIGADGFGHFNVGLAIVGLVQVVTDCGLRAIAIRDLSRLAPGNRRTLSSLLSLRLTLSTVAMLGAWAIALLLYPGSVDGLAIFASSLAVVPIGLAGLLSDAMLARDQAKITSGAAFWSGLSLTAASVLTVAFLPSAPALACSYLVGPLVNLTILARRCEATYGQLTIAWRPRQWRVLVRRALPFYRISVAGGLAGRLEVPLVGGMFGPSAAGVYAAAVGLADRLGIIIDSIATASLPTFMRLGKDRERLSSIISQVLSPAVAASLAGAIMALMGSTAAMVVIFGPDYSAGGPLLAIALFGLPILCVSSILFEGLIAVGQVEAASRITLRGQLVGVLCMPIFALVFGISGFPVARLSGNITAAATFLSTSASALPGLRRSARVSSMFASAAWALPVPIILWAEDFGPWATVAFSGGCYLLWVSRYFGIARLREYLKGDQLSGLNPD